MYNGIPLGKPHGDTYKIQNHHIFPQAFLYENGYDPENHLHRKIINEIANRAFITADTNLDISDENPSTYFPRVEQAYPGSLSKQFIPMKPDLWKIQRFNDFLKSRRENMAQKLTEFLDSLIKDHEPKELREKSITDLIKLGESITLEFKSTLQWDMIQNQVNKNLRKSVLKTIAGFMNTEGGTLLIGVEDGGAIMGIEKDLESMGNSKDKLEQLLMSLISEYLSVVYANLIRIRFAEADGKAVCKIDIDKAPEPVFLKDQRGKEFYIRMGNTSRLLDSEEAIRYVENNWA